jgi:hypothetical protein
VGIQALLVEGLLAGFFAIACFRARSGSATISELAPRRLFVLTDRIERLRKSRWQWCSMVLLLIFVRMQSGRPTVAELTVLAQFIVFLSLPAEAKPARVGRRKESLREALRRS